MPKIQLPDGSVKTFDEPVTVLQVAESIGAGLAKATLAGRIAERLVDASYLIEEDVTLTLITERDADGLEIIRHSSAHLLAQAVKSLYPSAQVTIGPVIEDGFYYDFAFSRPFTPDDLERIEKKMEALAKAAQTVTRQVMPRDKAIQFFRELGEEYKAKIIEDIPADEDLSLYTQGDFTDLCRGPHVPNTKCLKAFKLTKISGAYWRGDSKNEMLQRIYGTAWADKKALKAYLHRIEEAKKRDHRKLGKALDLFHFQEEAPGMVFWHDKGWSVYKTIMDYLSEKLVEHGYQEVRTPQILDRKLWEKSGHWDKFRDEMFITDTENHIYAIKPMNCPGHIQIFNSNLHSYRDLPLRMAEYGNCHRCEPSGALHGLMRLRNFVQDDAHIFCTEEQIQSEVSSIIDLVYQVYGDFGFDEIIIKLSTRPENRVGSDEIWDKSEKALEDALNNKKLAWELAPGEGAFYGPKIEFSLCDSLGRVWQCGTIQVDFSMPERLGATYIAEDSSKRIPVMLHRAVFGSLERFIGILIEEYAGNLPVWLAPTQLVICTITEKHAEFAQSLQKSLKNNQFRATVDLRNEKIGFKIREHSIQRIPFLLVIGDREVETHTVSVRTQAGDNLNSMSLEQLCDFLNGEIAKRGRRSPQKEQITA